MARLIRRLTIIVLLMVIFAMSFASLVVNPNRSFQRVNAGAALACQQSAVSASSCPVVL